MHPAHPTEVSEQCVVALTWTLKDTLGEVLDVLETPVEFLVGGDDLLTRIDQALQGHAVGDTLQLHLEPEDAFGDYDEQRVFLSARSAFPETLEEGMTFTIEPMVNGGDWKTKLLGDKWTVVTKDHKLSAQYEHTILVTKTGIEVLTARPEEDLSRFM